MPSRWLRDSGVLRHKAICRGLPVLVYLSLYPCPPDVGPTLLWTLLLVLQLLEDCCTGWEYRVGDCVALFHKCAAEWKLEKAYALLHQFVFCCQNHPPCGGQTRFTPHPVCLHHVPQAEALHPAPVSPPARCFMDEAPCLQESRSGLSVSCRLGG